MGNKIDFKYYNTVFQKLKRAKEREKKAKVLTYELADKLKETERILTKLKVHYQNTTSIEKLRKNPPE